jgi:hypothetical protein
MFDDIFNNDWGNSKDDDNNNNNNQFKKFYFSNWYIDPSKLFKGSMEDSRNINKWFFSPKRKPRIENVCVATMDDDEQAWYQGLLSRQNDISRRIATLQRQLDRAQHEQAIMDIDINEFNLVIRDRYNLSPEVYPELIIGNDAKHIYQQVDLSKPNNSNEE